MDKAKWTAVTDESEREELLARREEIDTPTFYAPNGLLWAVAEEYRKWRELRQQ